MALKKARIIMKSARVLKALGDCGLFFVVLKQIETIQLLAVSAWIFFQTALFTVEDLPRGTCSHVPFEKNNQCSRVPLEKQKMSNNVSMLPAENLSCSRVTVPFVAMLPCS